MIKRMVKQSSSDLSTLAAKYVSMSDDDFETIAGTWDATTRVAYDDPKRLQLWADIRSLAGSVLSQDETKGQSGGR